MNVWSYVVGSQFRVSNISIFLSAESQDQPSPPLDQNQQSDYWESAQSILLLKWSKWSNLSMVHIHHHQEGGWMVGALSRMLHFCCQVAAYSALSRYLALNKCLIRTKSVLILQLMGFVDASGEQEYDYNFRLKNSKLKWMLAALQQSQRHGILPSKVSWCVHTGAPDSAGQISSSA